MKYEKKDRFYLYDNWFAKIGEKIKDESCFNKGLSKFKLLISLSSDMYYECYTDSPEKYNWLECISYLRATNKLM